MDRRGFLRLWRQVLKTCQLYPSGSPVRSSAAERLCSALADPEWGGEEGISLAFFEDGAWVEGEPTEDEESRSELCRQVFGLGLREIRFLPGTTPQEILRLCDPLAEALLGRLNPVDEDLSVLLWEADLPHVVYFLYEEPSAERLLSPEELADEGSGEHPSVEEYLTPGVGDPAKIGLDWEGPPSEEQRASLLAAYRREEEEETPFKVGRLLCLLSGEETDAKQCACLGECLQGHLMTLLRQGRLAQMEALRPYLTPKPSSTGPANAVLTRLVRWMEGPEYQVTAAASEPSRPQDRQALVALMLRLPAAVLAELLGRRISGEINLPAEAGAVLDQRVRSEALVQLACLADRRAGVRRLALEESVLGTEGIRPLQELLADPDAGMRALAVSAIGRIPGPSALSLLGPALSDREESVRLSATEALASHGGAYALQALLRILVSSEFRRRSWQERRTVYAACGRAAPEEMRPFLVRLAERRGFWLSRRAREEASLALEALALLGNEIWPVLQQRWQRERPDLLRRLRGLLPRARAEDPPCSREERAA